MDDMITKIEAAVIARLKSNWAKATEFDITKDFGNIISYPSIAVTTEKIGFEWVISSYELRPVISVYMVFKAVQPAPRREGIYPMVTAAAVLLAGRRLGLDIDPLKPSGPIIEIVNEALVRTGAVAFRMELETAFAIDTDDGGMARLLSTANDYHYKMWESGTQLIEYDNDESAYHGE